MGFFEHYFKLEESYGEEVQVLCPFPHRTSTGAEYYESHPSAHVNTKTRLLHCKVCNQGFSESAFISKMLGCTCGDSIRLMKAFNNDETLEQWKQYTRLDEAGQKLAASLGISKEVCDELRLCNTSENVLEFPVFMYEKLIDIRTYCPGNTPKVRSRVGAISGAVIPMGYMANKKKAILLCAGEKDMATTRSHNFNAKCITGGEMAVPCCPEYFRGTNVVILYDNDDAGKLGARRLATFLLPYCETVKVCEKFHEICTEPGEDMTDYWNKYGGTREQLIEMMNATPLFTKDDAIKESPIPMLTLAEATQPKYINTLVKSNIQVVAVSDVQYVTPTAVTGEKLKTTESAKGNTLFPGEVRDWYYTEATMQDILHLTDGGFNEDQIKQNIMRLLKVPTTETYMRITKVSKEVVYKGTVTDMVESTSRDYMPMEYTAYSVGTRLESGKKYMCTYKLVPHPYKGQQLIMIIMNAVPASDSVSNFRITSEVKQTLDQFKLPGKSVAEKVNHFVQSVKGLLGYNGNDTLIEVIDLAYHTVLGFNLGQFKDVRGYLDTLIVGESRVGKSSTAEVLRNTYDLGVFTSLAGNSATIPGLIGGSNKTAGGGMQTKAGLIPQNHRGLIIFEEFGKCNSSIVTELTDIRSSNEVRITRVSGTLTLPAMVRMIALSNVKAIGNDIKPIASYPNGITIVTELVPTAEDIARYDMLCVLGDRGNMQIDPFWEPQEPYSIEAYRTKIRWVWSRTPEQIIISKEVGNFIIETANELNKTYDCHIKIFGTEAWKKLSRLAIAIAAYTLSTDENYQYIIVEKEHVQYAAELFIRLYDNPTFRLKEYVQNERKYSSIDENGITLLQNIYMKSPQLLLMLEQESSPSRNTLMAALGLDVNTYNGIMSQLIRGSFVKINGADISPTTRFRLGMAKINRDTRLREVGENDA